MLRKVRQGDVVEVKGKGYCFNDLSATAFDATLKSRRVGVNIAMHPADGGKQILIPFDDLKKAVEEAQSKEAGANTIEVPGVGQVSVTPSAMAAIDLASEEQ
ncbi:hypothetical protein L6258_00835 [Candidatus Parcubacteria bacterium]|nr:hypothetical protein [Candidatus Parcubacteria bacterium]